MSDYIMSGAPINPKQKALWVAALRSGEYKQSYGALKKTKRGVASYCCLGVLGEVCGIKYLGGSYLRDWGPEKVIVPGDRRPDVILLDFETQTTLSDMNDNERISFPEIAAWVEENVRTLP